MKNGTEENKPTPHPHAELTGKWANEGVRIQKYMSTVEDWRDDANPQWLPQCKYRIKPEESNEPWKPKNGETFYFVTNFYEEIKTSCAIWDEDSRDVDFSINNNYFRTSEEAEAAVERVKAALKGGTRNIDVEKVWLDNDIAGGLQFTVGELKKQFRKMSKENEQLKITNVNLHHTKELLIAKKSGIDGKPLTEGEKCLIKALRKTNITQVFGLGETMLCMSDLGDIYTENDHIAFCLSSKSSLVEKYSVVSALNKIQAEQEATK